jgi:hypothetical protein
MVEAMKIGADELVEIDGPPEIHRRQGVRGTGSVGGAHVD